MTEDEISSILKKTADYYKFITDTISSRQIVLKDEDITFLNNIKSYLAIISDVRSQHRYFKSHSHQNIISTCLTSLEGMDSIAKEYKIQF